MNFVAVVLLALAACASPAPRAWQPPDGPIDKRRQAALDIVAQAQVLLERQDYDAGLGRLKQAVAKDKRLRDLKPGEALRRLEGLFQDLDLPKRTLRRMELSLVSGEAAAAGHEAILAYGRGNDEQAILLASAAVGVDPGKETFRILLEVLAKRTGLTPDPADLIPRAALVERKLRDAEAAFFEKRFGEAARRCQQALHLAPDNPTGWLRLGSAQYAVGETEKARESYARAAALDPGNQGLTRFLQERGWQK